jgi:peptidoglycan hydrolase-like protein with peptidoglycan-binding domain
MRSAFKNSILLAGTIVMALCAVWVPHASAAITVYQDGEQYSTSPINFIFDTFGPETPTSTIKKLQRLLLQHGYSSGAVTGVMDAATIKGIKSFQQYYNLAADGKIGSATVKLLNMVSRQVGICADGKQRFVLVNPRNNKILTPGKTILVHWLSCGIPSSSKMTINFTIPGYGILPTTVTVGDRRTYVTLPSTTPTDTYRTNVTITVNKPADATDSTPIQTQAQ